MTLRYGRPVPGPRDGVARWRVAAVLGLWVAACGLLLARMFIIQVFDGPALTRMAVRQQIESLLLPGRRGFIFDRLGRPLAVNVEVDSVYAVPRAIDDPQAFARKVGPILQLDPRDVLTRLHRGGSYFAWLARRRPMAVSEAIRRLDLGDAIGIIPESRRVYPAGRLAAGVIGFAGTDGDGLAGLELRYDRVLRGTGGVEQASRDAIGRELIQTQRIVTPPRDGGTLVLTLDEVVQHIAERELGRAIERAHARDGVAIVMDPRTGGLLALASLPSFDPNDYQSAPPALWKSRAIADVYEPGSTFKLFLAAAALSSHAITPQDTFRDPGKIRINGATIHDAEPNEHFDSLTLFDIVKYSSNVGAAQVATRLGKTAFAAYIHQFGFGRPTGIDLPGEARGIIRPVRLWLGPSLQNIAFGQGISVTPIQLLVAASALATDGRAVHPHLVEAIRDADRASLDGADGVPSGQAPPKTGGDIGVEPPHAVIEPEVARQVLAMMRAVVQGGTGVKAQLDGYLVAGKTGTAQRPSPSGGYEPGGYVASFVGVVPAISPRLAILVIVDGPRGTYFGGDVAAPVFREIARQVLWYLHLPPSGPVPSSTAYVMPARGGETTRAP
jgi:cell division protein FtsI/penicillin-binding protein 2